MQYISRKEGSPNTEDIQVTKISRPAHKKILRMLERRELCVVIATRERNVFICGSCQVVPKGGKVAVTRIWKFTSTPLEVHLETSALSLPRSRSNGKNSRFRHDAI